MTLEPRLAECSTCKRINTAPEGCLLEWTEIPAYCGGCRKVVTHKLMRRERASQNRRVPFDTPPIDRPRVG
jgi:hypothetical protein